MLDTETKRRIDTARDILVGKVPDPKSQVEQITIALIYKFMDDMDAEAEELGGERKFFKGEFAKYGWAKLMSPAMGGHEVLNLYGEAITKMTENEGIPALFRDIFKNAYLPYRDPETLKSFLKIIDDFEYDHSERLGDAFEYLLSVLGSQGDAGQFRTPRHIIDFIVEVVEPQKGESILDPACGTAGFLISAYKFIKRNNSSEYEANDKENELPKGKNLNEVTLISPNHYSGDLLTPDERKDLVNNVTGYDISPDMVRLSLVNMYLHGFSNPHIEEYDSLTSDEYWNKMHDVILANPPFMTPKGGIKPHKLFEIQSKRAELLFVDYFLEHLSVNGKAGIIVPEGIMFVEQAAFKKIRKKLVEESLIAVITLPHGVFKPYASVKTHILILDKAMSKKSDSILFVNIASDGFTQSDTRMPTESNDLPEALEKISQFRKQIQNGGDFALDDALIEKNYCVVTKGEILNTTSIHLIGRWYNLNNAYPLAPKYKYDVLDNLCNIFDGQSPNMKTKPGEFTLVVPAENRKPSDHFTFDMKAICIPLVSSSGHGKADIKRLHYQEGKFALADTMCCVQSKNENILNPKYLYEILELRKDKLLVPLMAGATNVTMKSSSLKNIKIPIPSLEVQNEIVMGITLQKVYEEAEKLNDTIVNEIGGDFGSTESAKLLDLLKEVKAEKNSCLSIEHAWQ